MARVLKHCSPLPSSATSTSRVPTRMEQAEISGAAIAKQLASCSQSSRLRAVEHLCSWLPNQPGDPFATGISDAELTKIWKGLFFCVWHSDNLTAQVELINRLSTLLSSLPSPLAARYLDAFLLTIRREWSGIDFLRLDKFYLLIRRFLRHCFLFLKENSWNLDLTGKIVRVLSKGSLLSVDKFPAAGVNYHIAEILLDESLEFLPLANETLDLLLKPFFTVLQDSNDKVLVNKIKIGIFDRLAENGAKLLNDKDAGGEVEKFGRIALAMGFSKSFFDLASAAETQQGNRKVLFGLHERYVKLEKAVAKSGLDISLEHLDNGSSVQESEHIVGATEVFTSGGDGGDNNEKSVDRLVQKMKKGKKASDGTESKTKKKKKKSLTSSIDSNGVGSKNKSKSKKKKNKLEDSPAQGDGSIEIMGDAGAVVRNESSDGDSSKCNNSFSFDDTLISSLQKQFEKVAAEAGMASASNTKLPRKRKRLNTDNKQDLVSSENVVGGSGTGESVETNAKKVRFSMMNNLIWNPQNPLPPQSLRLPPSLTPRGSALKKGLSPGPIRESPPTVKKIKVKGSSVKKGRKTLTTMSPGIQRLRLLEALAL